MRVSVISEEKIKKIEKITQGFGFGLIQDVMTLVSLATQHDVGIDDLQDYIDYRKEQNIEETRVSVEEMHSREDKEKKLWESAAPECPECEDLLVRPRKLCGKKISTNKEGWSCLWYCIRGWDEDEPSGICGWEKYTHEDAVEITRDLMRGKLDGYNIP